MQAKKHAKRQFGILIVFLLFLVGLAGYFAIDNMKLTPAAKLPANSTIQLVAVKQDTDGQISGYLAELANGHTINVDRGVYEAWEKHPTGTLKSSQVHTVQTPASKDDYWFSAVFAVAAVAMLVLAIFLLLNVLDVAQPFLLKRLAQVAGGLGVAAGLIAVGFFIGQPIVRAVSVWNDARQVTPVTATVVDRATHTTGSGRDASTERVVLLLYATDKKTEIVGQFVGASTYAKLTKGKEVKVDPLDRPDQVMHLPLVKGTFPPVDWASNGIFWFLIFFVLLAAGAWQNRSKKKAQAAKQPTTPQAPERPERSRFQSGAMTQFVVRHGVIEGVAVLALVIAGVGAAVYHPATVSVAKVSTVPKVTAKTVTLSNKAAQDYLLRNEAALPKTAKGTQQKTFVKLTDRWAGLIATLLNGTKKSNAQREANRRLAIEQAKLVTDPTSGEGKALKTYANNVLEALAFIHKHTMIQSQRYLNDYLVYLSAEAVTLSHTYYHDQIPSSLTDLGKANQNMWDSTKDVNDAWSTSQNRWAYATTIASKKAILASKTPLLTLFTDEKIGRGQFDPATVKTSGQTITAGQLTLTFGQPRVSGKRLVISYTMTNHYAHAILPINILSLLGNGLTQRSDHKEDKSLYPATDTEGLTKAEAKAQQLPGRFLMPGKTVTAVIALANPVLTKPVYMVVGGGDYPAYPIQSVITVYPPTTK